MSGVDVTVLGFSGRVHKSPLNSFLYRSELMSEVRRLCGASDGITSLYVTAAFTRGDLSILSFLLYLNKHRN